MRVVFHLEILKGIFFFFSLSESDQKRQESFLDFTQGSGYIVSAWTENKVVFCSSYESHLFMSLVIARMF